MKGRQPIVERGELAEAGRGEALVVGGASRWMASVWCGEDADKGAGQLTRIEEGHRLRRCGGIRRDSAVLAGPT